MRARILAVALAIGAGLALPAAATAAEAILYDGNNCSGEYRMLDRSVANFHHIGFDNEVNSVMVITGTFRFYRDANYGEGNGPSFQLGPSGQQQTCWSLQDASQGTFPNNRMSSAQLVADSQGPQPVGVAVLYDNTNFGGQYRILTRAVSNFNAIGFDNRTESIRVLSGTWTFYRNDNFGAPPNRPSITLGVGDYADVANVPGYPPGTFPHDLMSSAQVAAGAPPPPPPPPPPLQCGPGQIAGNTQCVTCAQYSPNSVPSPAGDACVCVAPYQVAAVDSVDGVQVVGCTAPEAPTPVACPAPYHVLANDGRCVWSCGAGTQPDNASNECVCQPGLVQTGTDQFGRRQCSAPSQSPVQDVRYTVPARHLIGAAQAAGFTMTTQVDQGGARCEIRGDRIVFEMTNPPDNKPRTCTVTMFGGRPLAPGWRFEDYNASVAFGQANPTGLTAQLPFQLQLHIPPFQDKTIVDLLSIDLIGPSGANWQAALQ